jgi:hypothetical protein
MKKNILLFLIFLLPSLISAQNLNGRITSSFYTFERIDNASSSESFIRTFQSLNLNFNYSKISLRTRVNLETNIGNSLDQDVRLRFYNLYLEARDLFDFATIKLGRQPLFSQIAGGLFDGASLKFAYAGFSISGFYGGNVPAYQKLELTDDWENNYVMGGRFEFSGIENFNLGVNYFDKNFSSVDYNALRLNNELDPISILIQAKSNQYKYVSADLGFSLNNILDFNSKYEYDLNYKVTSNIEVDGRINAIDNLGVNFYYNYREPKIRYNSIFSVFNFGNSQEIEGGIDYRAANLATFFAKYGYVKYEDENSSRITVGANTEYGSLSYRKNLGYAGELDAVSIYAARTFFNGLVTPSIGISFTTYKLSKDSESNEITTLLAGFNIRPWKNWSFDIQGQYFNNKIYKNDLRALVKINYLFNTNF